MLKTHLRPRPGVLLQVQVPVTPLGIPRRPRRATPAPRDDPTEARGPAPAAKAAFRLLPPRGRPVLPRVAELQTRPVPAPSKWPDGPTKGALARLTSPGRPARPRAPPPSVEAKTPETSVGARPPPALPKDLEDTTNGPRPVPGADKPMRPSPLAGPLRPLTPPMKGSKRPREIGDTVAAPHLDHGMAEPRGPPDRPPPRRRAPTPKALTPRRAPPSGPRVPRRAAL